MFGYRPSYGDVRCVGVKESSGSLDTLGLLARSIEDIALYRDVLVRRDPEPLVADVPAPRIGFCHTHLRDRLEESTATLLEDAAAQLAKSGARVDAVTLPRELDDIADYHRVISSYEFVRNFSYEIEHHWDDLSESVRNGRIANGLEYDVEDYHQARYAAETCRRVLDTVFDDYDVLLTASAAGEAPVGLQSTGDASFCALWTTAHVPAISIPAFTGPNGLPIGVQVIGKRYADRALLQSAQWISQRLS